MPEDDSSADDWITLVSDVIGTGSGTLAGAFFAGPAGATAGAVAGTFLSHGLRALGRDVFSRHLSEREKKRIARVLVLAAAKIEERCEAGEKIRGDDFFRKAGPDRAHFEEVAEHVLIAAQRDPEEKKLTYIANLLAAITFEAAIDVGMAHQLISLVQSISYREFAIIALAANHSFFDLYDQVLEGIDGTQITAETASIAFDCFDLRQKGILFTGTAMDWGVHEITPASIRLLRVGHLLYKLMELSTMPQGDVAAVADPLSFGHAPIPPKEK